jgi:hypothetical protein
MKRSYCWLTIALGVLCGCGGAAHREGVALSKTLVQGQQDFAAANATEKDLETAARGWTEAIITGGAGKGAQLTQNAAVAADLAKSADSISTRLGLLRKAVYEEALQKEFTQGVRANLITQITRRQRTLQDLRTALTESAAQFQELSQTRSYKGDSYPTAIDTLNQMLQSYKAPADIVGQALASLKEEYGIKDQELK